MQSFFLKQKKLLIIIICLLSTVHAGPIIAQTLSSPSYNLEDSTFDSGGESSSSTNYSSTDSIGNQNDSETASSNYKSLFGFLWQAFPGVPGQPTLTNTGGVLYNTLDFIIDTGGNQTDTNFAIAISSDDFVTTYFIQTDDTLGTTAAWQDYVGWGSGTGETVTGLSPSTTYKIKAKARYGPDSETGYSLTASATTSAPNLTVTFSGVSSGVTTEGETTTLTSTANTIPYGSLAINTPAIAAHITTVTTNATGGYTTTLRQDGELRTVTQQIDPVSGTNASPTTWPGGVTTGAFGYHSSDDTLCTGTTSRFLTNNTFAAMTTSPEEVGCSTAPVTNEATTVLYKLEIGSLQPSGNYQNVATYITTAVF